MIDTLRDRARAEAARLMSYRDRPVEFCREELRHEPAEFQARVLNDLAAHPRVWMAAGRGVGKSDTAAMAWDWWLATRPLGRVIAAGPQLENSISLNLLPRAYSLLLRSPTLREMFVAGATSITARGEAFRKTWGGWGLAIESPEFAAGQHAKSLLLILDEAAAIPRRACHILLGSLTEGADNRALIIGTPPLQAVGFFAGLIEGTAVA